MNSSEKISKSISRLPQKWMSLDANCIMADASILANPNVSEFAWAIYKEGKLENKGEELEKSEKAAILEISGYLHVLKKIPKDGKPIHLLHDQNDLEMMLNSKSYREKLEPNLSLLREELIGRDILFFRTKKERAHKECHNRIRKFLKELQTEIKENRNHR